VVVHRTRLDTVGVTLPELRVAYEELGDEWYQAKKEYVGPQAPPFVIRSQDAKYAGKATLSMCPEVIN
jgi:hypothetical protein